MREATGNAYIFYFVIIFTGIFIALLVGSISYSKAFRVKNIIIDAIETDGGWITGDCSANGNSTCAKTLAALREVGYKVATPDCSASDINATGTVTVMQNNGGYDYCVYRISTSSDSANYRGDYYKVVAYIYFDIPIIGKMLEFPVSGETKNIYDAPKPR